MWHHTCYGNHAHGHDFTPDHGESTGVLSLAGAVLPARGVGSGSPGDGAEAGGVVACPAEAARAVTRTSSSLALITASFSSSATYSSMGMPPVSSVAS